MFKLAHTFNIKKTAIIAEIITPLKLFNLRIKKRAHFS